VTNKTTEKISGFNSEMVSKQVESMIRNLLPVENSVVGEKVAPHKNYTQSRVGRTRIRRNSLQSVVHLFASSFTHIYTVLNHKATFKMQT